MRACMVRTLAPAGTRNAPSTRRKYLKLSLKAALPASAESGMTIVASLLSWEHVALDLEAVNAHLVAPTLARHEIFEKGKILLEPVVFVLEHLHLGGKLHLRRLLDLEARFARVGDRAQPRRLGFEPRHGIANPREVALQFAAVEAGEPPSRVVHPRRHGKRKRKEYEHSEPAPIPGDVGLDRHLRRRNPEALLEPLEQSRHRSPTGRVRAQSQAAKGRASPLSRT